MDGNGGSAPPKLTAEAAAQFQEGINLVLSRWTALQMAIENEWGGRDSRQKSDQFALEIFLLLTQSKEKVYIDDVEDALDEFMLSLSTEIADGSIEEIAERLMVMHEECLDGNFNSIQKLKETNPGRVTAACVRKAASDDEDDDDDGADEDKTWVNDGPSDMAVDVSMNQKDMIVDEPTVEAAETEDGWTVVGSSRRNRSKRS